MPLFHVRTCNFEFEAIDEEGSRFEQAEDALKSGIDSAMAVASDEIREGQRSAAVDVCVEDAEGEQLLHSVVAMSVSPLMVKAGSADPVVTGSVPASK